MTDLLFSSSIAACVDGIFFCAGEERRGLAELGSGLQARPTRSSVKKCLLCGVGDLALAQLQPDLGRRLGQDGKDQRGDDANGLGGRGQHAGLKRSVVGVGAVGRLLPRRVGGQVAVGFGDQDPDAFERVGEIQLVEGTAEGGDGRSRAVARRFFFGGGWSARLRHDAAKILVHHVDDAADQVAVAVGEVAVVALDQSIEAEVAILAEGNLAQQEVAQCVGAQNFA